MSSGDRIAAVARAVLAGRIVPKAGGVDLTREPGWCLAFARRIVETALEAPDGTFYARWGTERVSRAPGPPDGSWWARDLERSMRNLGLAVREGEPARDGDLLYNWRAAPNAHGVYVGHVGILVDANAGLVLENVDARYRRFSLTRGAVALTPRDRFPVTTTIRIPDAPPPS
ncbi:hypothetical protein [Natronococcus sp.]|uniref:hypothetical protein n=1 Tax=Natronococcus sp. TaxID=35747 RepID=UPI003A4DA35A